MKTHLLILYDETTQTYYVSRPDDPTKPYHPLTLGAIIQLDRDMVKYEHDAWVENGRRI